MDPSTPSTSHDSEDAEPGTARSLVGLMIAVAVATLGIVFVIALLDMRDEGPAPARRGAAQEAREGAKAAPLP